MEEFLGQNKIGNEIGNIQDDVGIKLKLYFGFSLNVGNQTLIRNGHPKARVVALLKIKHSN